MAPCAPLVAGCRSSYCSGTQMVYILFWGLKYLGKSLANSRQLLQWESVSIPRILKMASKHVREKLKQLLERGTCNKIILHIIYLQHLIKQYTTIYLLQPLYNTPECLVCRKLYKLYNVCVWNFIKQTSPPCMDHCHLFPQSSCHMLVVYVLRVCLTDDKTETRWSVGQAKNRIKLARRSWIP